MKIEKFNLWEKVPGLCEETPYITAYIPEIKNRGALVIFPGGSYVKRAEHEGHHYARFFAEKGYASFVVDYRVSPHRFPLPLLDARRAVCFVRYNADKFGIDKDKIAVMGSSAGGHLASLTSTYFEKIDFEGKDEIDNENFIPNAQILCYPVIEFEAPVGHVGSGQSLLGDAYKNESKNFVPSSHINEKTPPAFIWHTFEDDVVDVRNSINYMSALRENNIPSELHIFPNGGHGMGLATVDHEVHIHNHQWTNLLLMWLKYNNF